MALEERLRQEFSEDTAYERLLLPSVVRPNPQPAGAATNDIRGHGPRTFGRDLFVSSGSVALESFAARFRPLAFGAAYKVLDFVVEMTMLLNNERRPSGRWTFAEKKRFVGRGVPTRLPAPLDSVRP